MSPLCHCSLLNPEQLSSWFPFRHFHEKFLWFGGTLTPVTHWFVPPSFPSFCVFIKPLSLLWLPASLFSYFSVLSFSKAGPITFYIYLFLIFQSFQRLLFPFSYLSNFDKYLSIFWKLLIKSFSLFLNIIFPKTGIWVVVTSAPSGIFQICETLHHLWLQSQCWVFLPSVFSCPESLFLT